MEDEMEISICCTKKKKKGKKKSGGDWEEFSLPAEDL